jgi:hypothetical protein
VAGLGRRQVRTGSFPEGLLELSSARGWPPRRIADAESYPSRTGPALRRRCSFTRTSHAACRAENKGFRIRFLGTDRFGFDSHHPLQSQPRISKNSQDGAVPQARRDPGPRWPGLATGSHAAVVPVCSRAHLPWAADAARMSTDAKSRPSRAQRGWPESRHPRESANPRPFRTMSVARDERRQKLRTAGREPGRDRTDAGGVH